MNKETFKISNLISDAGQKKNTKLVIKFIDQQHLVASV
jgi:hypothetical protein